MPWLSYLMQKAMSFNVAVVSVKGNEYRIQFWYMEKDEAINIPQKFWFNIKKWIIVKIIFLSVHKWWIITILNIKEIEKNCYNKQKTVIIMKLVRKRQINIIKEMKKGCWNKHEINIENYHIKKKV